MSITIDMDAGDPTLPGAGANLKAYVFRVVVSDASKDVDVTTAMDDGGPPPDARLRVFGVPDLDDADVLYDSGMVTEPAFSGELAPGTYYFVLEVDLDDGVGFFVAGRSFTIARADAALPVDEVPTTDFRGVPYIDYAAYALPTEINGIDPYRKKGDHHWIFPEAGDPSLSPAEEIAATGGITFENHKVYPLLYFLDPADANYYTGLAPIQVSLASADPDGLTNPDFIITTLDPSGTPIHAGDVFVRSTNGKLYRCYSRVAAPSDPRDGKLLGYLVVTGENPTGDDAFDDGLTDAEWAAQMTLVRGPYDPSPPVPVDRARVRVYRASDVATGQHVAEGPVLTPSDSSGGFYTSSFTTPPLAPGYYVLALVTDNEGPVGAFVDGSVAVRATTLTGYFDDTSV